MPDHRESRRTGLKSLFAVLVVGLGVAAAWAGTAASGDSADRRVSLSARDMDVKNFLHLVASQVNANLAFEGLSGKISLDIKGGKLSDVMDNFCEAYSCKWSLTKGEPLVLLVRSKTKA